MTIPRRGSRKIEVNERAYRWHVSKWRRISDWHPDDLELLDSQWLGQACRFGLGSTADVAFTIAIEPYDAPVSKILVKYYAKIIDGFLGPEQLTKISPHLIRDLVERSLASGWAPDKKGNYSLEIIENSGERQRPALLVLPDLKNDIKGYENCIVPICILEKEQQYGTSPNSQELEAARPKLNADC